MADIITCHGVCTAGGQSLVSLIWCVGMNFVATLFMYSARGMKRDNLGLSNCHTLASTDVALE